MGGEMWNHVKLVLAIASIIAAFGAFHLYLEVNSKLSQSMPREQALAEMSWCLKHDGIFTLQHASGDRYTFSCMFEYPPEKI